MFKNVTTVGWSTGLGIMPGGLKLMFGGGA